MKTLIFPKAVDAGCNIVRSRAEAAKLRDMFISDLKIRQRYGKYVSIVLWICSRARNVRPSTTRLTWDAASKSMNSPIGRVEWPMVKNGIAMFATADSYLRSAVSRGVSTRWLCVRRRDRFCRSLFHTAVRLERHGGHNLCN